MYNAFHELLAYSQMFHTFGIVEHVMLYESQVYRPVLGLLPLPGQQSILLACLLSNLHLARHEPNPNPKILLNRGCDSNR